MRLRVGAATDPGRVRPMNEDVYLAREAEGLFVVCDGMGGCPAGEVASRIAVDAIVAELCGPPDEAGTPIDEDRRYLARTTRLAAAVRRSNALIYDLAQEDPRRLGMGTTMVGAWISEHVASVAHVGDSRAYLWRSNCLEPLTQDHAAAAHQHVLLRALGREPKVDVELSEVPLRPGDYLLLCSDGLTRMVADDAVAAAICELRDPQTICHHLIATANDNGGRDNITLVVVEVRGRWWRRTVDRFRPPTGGSRDGDAGAAV
jgi:PPM family protein phosphatase